ncbi:MAG: SDR family NAD(P)-dependent oxidoreductase, partial [Vicinamibacteria bacterium]
MSGNASVSPVLEPAVDPSAPVATLDLDAVRRCTELLESIAADRGVLASVPLEMRQALLIAAGQISRPQSFQEKRLVKTLRRVRKQGEEAVDRESRATTGIRQAREAAVFVAPAPALPGDSATAPPRELKKPRSCYVCKEDFVRLHHFYDSMCPECAELNYAKRFQAADLTGRVAVVTGSRVKIGFHISLKMLRAGCEVIATTRFPQDSALRYSREPDFAEWKHRIHVHGLDLRHPPSVEIFARYIEHSFPRLDFIVNNACQTVRRPPGFYEDLLPTESRAASDFGPDIYRVLKSHEGLKAALDPSAAPDGALRASGASSTRGMV